jgi:hypothetical protein
LFTNALIDEMEKYGYEVTLGQAADEFLGSDNPDWIIQLSLLQLLKKIIPAHLLMGTTISMRNITRNTGTIRYL